MILDAETALLEATHQRILEGLSEVKSDMIDIEIDDLAPSMAGNVYYAISPNAGSPGRYDGTSWETFHYEFGVRVVVLEKMGTYPRDRQRSAFISRLRSINQRLKGVSRMLRFDYAVISMANANLNTEGIAGKFHKPLVPQSVDTKPRLLTSPIVGARTAGTGGNTDIIMSRGINFGRAEFIGKDHHDYN